MQSFDAVIKTFIMYLCTIPRYIRAVNMNISSFHIHVLISNYPFHIISSAIIPCIIWQLIYNRSPSINCFTALFNNYYSRSNQKRNRDTIQNISSHASITQYCTYLYIYLFVSSYIFQTKESVNCCRLWHDMTFRLFS